MVCRKGDMRADTLNGRKIYGQGDQYGLVRLLHRIRSL